MQKRINEENESDDGDYEFEISSDEDSNYVGVGNKDLDKLVVDQREKDCVKIIKDYFNQYPSNSKAVLIYGSKHKFYKYFSLNDYNFISITTE